MLEWRLTYYRDSGHRIVLMHPADPRISFVSFVDQPLLNESASGPES